MHYLADYGLFFAKTLTLVIAFLIIMSVELTLIVKNKEQSKTRL
jgi:hypothetical protein